MIPLPEIKPWLEINAGDSSVDVILTSLEAAAVAFLEGETGRHFGPPSSFTEFVLGDGGPKLRLAEVPGSSPATVEERVYPGADPTTITAANDDGYELRTLLLPQATNLAWLLRKNGCVWTRGYEYTATYQRGYSAGNEPVEVKQKVIDLVQLKWQQWLAAGGALRTESIGPYTYTNADVMGLPERDGESWLSFVQRWRGWVFA